MWDGPMCDGPCEKRQETFIESSFSKISPLRVALRDFVRIIHSLVKLYQVLEKESWLKIEDLTNSSSLSNYTSCPAQTKLQHSVKPSASLESGTHRPEPVGLRTRTRTILEISNCTGRVLTVQSQSTSSSIYKND